MKKVILNIILFFVGVLVGKFFFSEKNIEQKEVIKVVTKEVKVPSLKIKIDDKPRAKVEVDKNSYTNRIDKKDIEVNRLFDKIASFDSYADREINMDVITLYEEILRINPTSKKALSEFSNYLIAKGHMNEAKRVLEDCLKSHPNDELCLGNYTSYGIHDGDNMAIDESIKTCLVRTPHNAKCIHNKGNSLLRQGQYKSAVETFKLLLNQDGPKSKIIFHKEIVYYSIANAYRAANDLVNAKEYFRMACDEGEEYSCKILEDLNKK
ncbi:tetratricopeptide repeat protein [Halobacteriovorax sp. DPLXC-1]|uniref:tetratricopeptide repeat protein n=1 Tax=Halobacteriovorax sp. DPLXC-1 TaxID=3110771 RepID=UPI002FF1F155